MKENGPSRFGLRTGDKSYTIRAPSKRWPAYTRRTVMVTAQVQDQINVQINNELSSSYSYLAMSAWCERENFLGSAKWFRIQSHEEHGHAMRLLDFLLD